MTSDSKTKVNNRDAWDSISKEDSTSKNNVMVLFSSSCRGLGWGCLSITERYRTNTNKKTRRIGGSSMFLWCICNYIDSCLFISVWKEKIPGLDIFCINSIGLWPWRGYGKVVGPLLQEELCPTSLPWWTDHFPEMYRRNQSFLDPSSRWVHLGRSRDNRMNNRGPILHRSVSAISSRSHKIS